MLCYVALINMLHSNSEAIISGVGTDGGQAGLWWDPLWYAGPGSGCALPWVCMYVRANNTAPFKYFIGAGILELLSPCLRN